MIWATRPSGVPPVGTGVQSAPMGRTLKLLGTVALVGIAATSCTSDGGASVPATFALTRTPKQDCAGPWTCRIGFTLDVARQDNPGTNIFRCDLRALDERGAVVASGTVRAALGTVGKVPSEGVLSPEVRRTVASIDGTCIALDPEGDLAG
jgi:hypothetical protein